RRILSRRALRLHARQERTMSGVSPTRSALVAAFVLAFVLAATGGLTGCAGLGQRVDRSLLDGVPNEEKLLLFDAENGVYIAKDEMETAERALGDAARALSRAKAFAKVIKERRASG